MLCENHIDILSNPKSPGKQGGHIDKDFIKPFINGKTQYGYVCGPDEFVAKMKDYLLELGIPEKQLIFEH